MILYSVCVFNCIRICLSQLMQKARNRYSEGNTSFDEEEATDKENDSHKLQIFMDQILDAHSGKRFADIEIVDNFYTMLVGVRLMRFDWVMNKTK